MLWLGIVIGVVGAIAAILVAGAWVYVKMHGPGWPH